ncbi:MAG TPA: alkane 1-monooxygenase [Bdellovibrionota bacterium]|nr:alkane 1-monooxygenase [Bdellovibrionota bacterium]
MNLELAAPFLSAYVLAALSTLALLQGGPWVIAPLLLTFGLHPLMDLWVGPEKENPPRPDAATARLMDSMAYVAPPLLTVALVFVIQKFSALATHGWEFWGAALGMGLMSAGLGINVGHELIHRPRKWERGLGVWLYALVNYSHFRIEHVHGHHSHVATPEDPATARKGELLYAFWFRSIVGQVRSAWAIETRRLKKRAPLERLLQNRMGHYLLISLAISAGLTAAFGPWGLVFFWAQGLIAVLFLETINFIEHYGLERKARPAGGYEPVTERHSWDTDYQLTNWALFNLGKHSRHHASPLLPYHKLSLSPGAPRLPWGYSVMAVLAFFPPIYRRVMDRTFQGLASQPPATS